MRGAALLATLVALAAWRDGGCGAASANVVKTVVKQHAQPAPKRPIGGGEGNTAVSSNGTAGAALGAAPGAGHGARVGEEQLSHVLWLRYTQPRLMTGAPAHATETVTQGVVTQLMSHDDPDNNATWQQTYYRCDDSYAPGGPAFVMLSGTSDYRIPGGDWLREGHMATLARKFKADRFFLPTRFFGANSRPTTDATVDSLKYLTVEEVLRDVAEFLEQLKGAGILREDQKVVLFGAGFGGTVATWARMRHPDLVHGVVASSATLEPRLSVTTYFPVVSKAMDWYHAPYGCSDRLRAGFQELEQALLRPEGRAEFNSAFQPCEDLAVDAAVSEDDRAHILGLVASVFANLVQEDEDGPRDQTYYRPGGDKLWPYCQILYQSTDSPLTTLGRLVEYTLPGVCMKTAFADLIAALSATAWSDKANSGGPRPWLWLQCTELAQFPTTSGSTDTFPYSTKLNYNFYRKLCESVFSEGVTANLVDSIAALTANYGGLKPDVTNAVFVKGDLDPWKALSPPDTAANDGMLVLNVLRASHAHDLFPRDDYDPPWMKKARKAVESSVASWLS